MTTNEQREAWLRSMVGDGCWPWPYTKGRDGYGQIAIGGRGGHRRMAHRWAYELLVGPIPEGLTLDHLCRNTGCVNPAHLEPVTMRVNLLRGNSVSAIHSRKTHCPKGHEYAGDNLANWCHSRYCRECQRTRSREYQRRLRARLKAEQKPSLA